MDRLLLTASLMVAVCLALPELARFAEGAVTPLVFIVAAGLFLRFALPPTGRRRW